MLKFKSISIKNFLSVGNKTQVVSLNPQGVILILGKNHDVDQEESRNGVGKSTLIQALSYVLYGEPITKIRINNLCNDINQKQMLVTVTFEKDGKNYSIERGRKPDVLKFSEIGKKNDATGVNANTQATINNLLGMSHTMFTHIVATNTFTEPFLKLSPTPQREVIEELLGITLLSNRDEAVKKLIKDTKAEIEKEEIYIKTNIEANARIEKTIERTKNDLLIWDTKVNKAIKELTDDIFALDNIDYDKEIKIFDDMVLWTEENNKFDQLLVTRKQQINEKNNLISRVNQDINDLRKTSIDDKLIRVLKDKLNKLEQESISTPDDSIVKINFKIERYELHILALTNKITNYKNELTELQNALLSEHTCETCGQELDETHLEDIKKKINLKIKQKEDELTLANQSIEDYNKTIEDQRKEISDIKEAHSNKIIALEQEILSTKSELEKSHEQQKITLETLENKLSAYTSEIDVLKQEIADLNIEIQNITKDQKALGGKPTSDFPSKEHVWQLRDEKNNLIIALENEKNKINPHIKHLENLLETLKFISYDKINELRDDLKHQEFLHKILSNKDSFVRKKIIDQNIIELNTRINYYLELLGIPHEMVFLTDMTVDINKNGRSLDFPQLCRGEQSRMILSNNWAFRDIWESLNFSWNILFVDELIDNGIDGAGAENALDVLRKMSINKKNIFLISHKESLKNKTDKTLMVHLEDQFTRFEYGEAE